MERPLLQDHVNPRIKSLHIVEFGKEFRRPNPSHLVDRLAGAEDEIDDALDGAKLEVVSPLKIPQSVLQPKESASIEGTLIASYHGCHCRHSRVTIVPWIVIGILFIIQYVS